MYLIIETSMSETTRPTIISATSQGQTCRQ